MSQNLGEIEREFKFNVENNEKYNDVSLDNLLTEQSSDGSSSGSETGQSQVQTQPIKTTLKPILGQKLEKETESAIEENIIINDGSNPVVIYKETPKKDNTLKDDGTQKENPKENTTQTHNNPKMNSDNNQIKVQLCKNNSDCNSEFFCHLKSGKCIVKFNLHQSGCSTNDQCAAMESTNRYIVCYGNHCKQACKAGKGGGCPEAENCAIVKDRRMFQGLTFNGVCTGTEMKNKSSGTFKQLGTRSKSSIILIGGSALILLVGLIIGFSYLRGYMRRRHRNNSPDLFLFQKLQRNPSQNFQRTTSNAPIAGDQLDFRLSGMGGARFTRWAALSDNN